MINRTIEISSPIYARVAGFGYLIMTIAAIFANFLVLSNLIVPGDAITTANNIMNNEFLFLIGITNFLIVIVCDLLVAWSLYFLLKPVNESLSLLTAWFRLVYAAIFGITLLNLFLVWQLLSGADYLVVFDTDQLHALVLLFLNAFDYGWLIGIIFFDIHLFVLGYLVFKSGYFPRILGVLLIVASLGYLLDSFAQFLLSNYASYEVIFFLIAAVPSMIAELSLCMWLLLKGAKNLELKP